MTLLRLLGAPFYVARMVLASSTMALDRICMTFGMQPLLADITGEFERMTRDSIARTKAYEQIAAEAQEQAEIVRGLIAEVARLQSVAPRAVERKKS